MKKISEIVKKGNVQKGNTYMKKSILKLKLIIYLLILLPIGGISFTANAWNCVLDTSNDGFATDGVDTVGDADSESSADQLACGNMAKALGHLSISIGNNSQASGFISNAIGYLSESTDSYATAIGSRTKAFGDESTAIGSHARANGKGSIAIGPRARTIKEPGTFFDQYIAIGSGAKTSGVRASSIGVQANASGRNSLAIGTFTRTSSDDSIYMGFWSGYNGGQANNDSPNSIAIGSWSNIGAASPGAIAIGGDVDRVNRGTQALAAGAIALGADVVNDIPHSMLIKVPLRMVRDTDAQNGPIPHHQLKIADNYIGKDVRTLLNLQCKTCSPGFRFNQIFPANNTWFFRMLQTGNFSVDDPSTLEIEAEFRSGGNLKIGGTLIQASSREIKTNFVELNHNEILDKIDQLPITQWSYKKDQGKVKHIGPVAEDFYQAFGLGDSNKGISSVDTSGVALAAIKALKQENETLKAEKDQQIANLQYQMAELKQQLALVLAMSGNTQLTQVAVPD